MATVQAPVEQRLLFPRVSWSDYVRFSDLLDQRHVRVTYDGTRMEFMTVSPEHERAKKLLDRLLAVLTEELDLDIAGFGSMTCRREDLNRGLEPDECYWVKNEPKVRGRTDIDLSRDPPPDLVLEVEISRSALDRMAIYARLGVPEVWRWDGQTLHVCLLQPDGTYAESQQSQAFPFLPMKEVERFLRDGARLREAELLRRFRKWVRQRLVRKRKPAARRTRKKKES
ncbi:MAG TPA: Uma2 family endonuclease [Gemmataceae bacterium]|nr:Uma2 family endonuclease [Gemmataceae bacterium]